MSSESCVSSIWSVVTLNVRDVVQELTLGYKNKMGMMMMSPLRKYRRVTPTSKSPSCASMGITIRLGLRHI